MADLEELLRAVGVDIVAVTEDINATSDPDEKKQLREEKLLLLQRRNAAGK